MNELEQTLAKILEKSLELAEKTGEFALEQAPELLQEFYRWHTIEHIFFIVLSIIVLLIGINIPRLWSENGKDLQYDEDCYWKVFGRYYHDEGSQQALATVWLLSSIAFIAMFTAHLHKLLFLLTAPKIYLIEYFL